MSYRAPKVRVKRSYRRDGGGPALPVYVVVCPVCLPPLVGQRARRKDAELSARAHLAWHRQQHQQGVDR